MQRRQPLPAYSGATTLRHDDDKHAKHLHARTRKLWIAAAVVERRRAEKRQKPGAGE